MRAVWCVCVYSAHALTADVCIAEMARAAEFCLSDGLVLTGPSTGVQANPQELSGELQLHSSSTHSSSPLQSTLTGCYYIIITACITSVFIPTFISMNK